MIPHIANLMRWEWFKLRRRWMPWILLAVILLFSQLVVWGNFFGYRHTESTGGSISFGAVGPGGRDAEISVTCNDLLAGRLPDLPPGMDPGIIDQMRQNCERIAEQQQQQLQDRYASFTLPGSISSALGMAQGIGLVLIAILATSMLGTEYGWGTLRAVLSRGTGRWQYLTAKLALLALLAAAALVAVLAVTAVSSLLAGALAGAASEGVPASAGWADGAITFVRAWFALLPYVALATFVTVLTSSSVAGLAVSLGYYFAELIAVAILVNIFDWFQTVADYVLGRNITAVMLGSQRGEVSGDTFGGPLIGEYPGDLHAFLVVAAYTLVLGGLAFWLFRRRDVAVTSGG